MLTPCFLLHHVLIPSARFKLFVFLSIMKGLSITPNRLNNSYAVYVKYGLGLVG